MIRWIYQVGRICFSITALLYTIEATPQSALDSLTPDQMRADLEFLRTTWISLDLSFSPDERHTFEAVVEDLYARADDLTPTEFALEIQRAVAVSRNAHTEVDLTGVQTFLPIRLWWFSDGLYIVEAHPELSNLLGARVDKIGQLSAEEAFQRVAPYSSGTDEYIRFLSIINLISPESLKLSGVVDSVDEVALTVNIHGEAHVVSLKPRSTSGPPPGGGGVLVPAPSSNSSRWPHVLDALSDLPPAFQGPLRDVAVQWIGVNGDVLYIRNERTQSADDVRLDDKLLGIIGAEILPRRPKYVVVDLRLNTGGNLLQTIVFSQSLPRLIPEGGKIFVLIGNPTLSAAIATAMMLKGNGREKVLFIGERMGDHAQFWAENPVVRLPNSGLPLTYATGFHDWSGNCSENEHCYWATEVFATPGLSTLPDVTVALRFEDYAAGQDTVLETALTLVE